MDNNKYLQVIWESYLKTVVPDNPPPGAVEFTKMAFFGGCSALFYLLIYGVSPGEIPTPADIKLMESIQSELDEYAASMKTDTGHTTH